MKPSRTRSALLTAAAFALAACAEQPSSPTPSVRNLPETRSAVSPVPGSYMLMTAGGKFDSGLAAAVAAAGGRLENNAAEIGVAFASSDDPGFAARALKIKGVSTVVPDLMVEWIKPGVGEATSEVESSDPVATVAGGTDETFWNAQWNVPSIDADDAQATGATGAGVRVAILDGGIHRTHIDLDAQIDAINSKSFIPNTVANWDWFQDLGTFWHGTHVAGIVAAEDNSIGTIGVAPGATIIGVKVLHGGSGAFGWVISGIYYAATPIAEGGAGADIINMSLGATFLKEPNDGSAQLLVALSRATNYARQQGVAVIVAAGNNGADLDHTQHLVTVPAQSVGVTTIAATGPLGWIANGATDFSRPASYTNFGHSLISLAGPGGDFVLPGNAICSVPRIPSGTLSAPCWVFDMVLSTTRGGAASISSYSWAAGTSMASPAVAGVAALVLGKFGPMNPAQLEAKLRQGATDVGKPGNDVFAGAGYINALAALQ